MPIIKGFELLTNLPEEKLTDQITRRVLAGDKEMIVWWSMKAGAHAAAANKSASKVFVLVRTTRQS